MESLHLNGLGLQHLDTPPITPADSAKRHKQHVQQPLKEITNVGGPTWTPPASPLDGRSHQPSLPATKSNAALLSSPVQSTKPIISSTAPQESLFEPTDCPFEVEIQHDGSGYEVVYGMGAWSTVLSARPKSTETKSVLLTPPTSPIERSPKVVAVKRPNSKHASKIIHSEGIILSYMARLKKYDSHVTRFYGIDRMSSSLVLAAVPLTLEHYIKERAFITNARSTTWTMGEPGIGSTKRWLDIAHQLVSSLSWLHTVAHVVHADIKPSNIMLAPTSTSTTTTRNPSQDLELDIDVPFRPLFSDFSSSHIFPPPQALPADPFSSQSHTVQALQLQELASRNQIPALHTTLSALSPPYTAPELLSRAFLANPNSRPAPSSDIFSLALVLLACATGDPSIYGSRTSSYQVTAMGKQGWSVLDFVRGGVADDDGGAGFASARIHKGGVVDRVLAPAVRKVNDGEKGGATGERSDAKSWIRIVESVMEEKHT